MTESNHHHQEPASRLWNATDSIRAGLIRSAADGQAVGRIVVTFPDHPAGRMGRRAAGGRVTAYIHLYGQPAVEGLCAGGGGYDRQSAAISAAARRLPDSEPHSAAIRAELADLRGRCWVGRLVAAGYWYDDVV